MSNDNYYKKMEYIIINLFNKDELSHKLVYNNVNANYMMVWDDIKNISKHMNLGNSLENYYNKLTSLKNYKLGYKTNIVYDYICDIIFDYNTILFKVYHKNDYDKKIITYENRWINDDYEGNCVDHFIKVGVQSQIENINDLIKEIQSRLPERQNTNQYHDTGCYEKDFAHIILIRDFANKIVEKCNKHLEKISDFYTRIKY